MIAQPYHTTGIRLSYEPSLGLWLAAMEATRGRFGAPGRLTLELRTYEYEELRRAIDLVLEERERFGVEFAPVPDGPTLYVQGDGEDPAVPLPPDWRAQLAEQSARLGWEFIYAAEPDAPCVVTVPCPRCGELTITATAELIGGGGGRILSIDLDDLRDDGCPLSTADRDSAFDALVAAGRAAFGLGPAEVA